MHPVEQALRAAVIDAWVKGTPATQYALAQAITQRGAAADPPFRVTQRQVSLWFSKWAEAGISHSQTNSNGQPGGAYAFNWTGQPLDACSLLDAARPILVAGDGTPRRDDGANKVRTALRIALGVGEHGSDHRLLKACAEVPVNELHALPERAVVAAVATARRAGQDGVGKATAANYRATLRAFLREAALADRVPVVLPRVWAHDGWEELRDRFFGAPVDGLTQTQRTLRCYWGHFVAGVKALKPAPGTFDAVTPAMVAEIYEAFRQRGELETPQHVRWMLRRVAREHGVGPYADAVGGRRSRNGLLNEDRLMGPNGEAASDGDWDAFLVMVDGAGYSSAWLEHLAWYGDFISLSEHAIESDPARFPTRPVRWMLQDTTRVKRVIDLRTILFHAPRLLGCRAASLTPHYVFGGDGARKMLTGLEQRWRERQRAGQVSSGNSSGLEKLVISFGLVARSFELRLHHALARGQEAALPWLGAVAPAQAQAAFAEAYRSAGVKAKNIEKARRRESTGHGDNTVRSVARIVRNSPASYWVRLNDEALRRVQSHLVHDRQGLRTAELADGVKPKAFYALVADTYYLGWLISTGMRIEETVHVRLDMQFTPAMQAEREVHLRAIDRKETPNTLPHECKLRERFVPRWLEQLYLGKARPYLMAVYPALRRTTKGGSVRKRGRATHDHPWLFVTTRGVPYGCPGEDTDGSGRDKLALRDRKNNLRNRFKKFCARLAYDLKLPVLTLPKEGSNHVVRIAVGYEVYQTLGLTAAANYLGDQENSIIGHYQGVKGARANVDAIALDDFVDWEPPTVRARRGEVDGSTALSPRGVGGAGGRRARAAQAAAASSAPEAVGGTTVLVPTPATSATETLGLELRQLKRLRDEGLIEAQDFDMLRAALVKQVLAA